MAKRKRQLVCVILSLNVHIFSLTLDNYCRCECVKCLGALTQSYRTRQSHMQKYGCIVRSVPDLREMTTQTTIQSPPSSPQSADVDDDEHSPISPSPSEQRDQDYDPIIHQQLNPSDSDSDSDNDNFIDQDSSDDERPILDDVLGSISNASDNENNTEKDEDFELQGLILSFKLCA